MDCVHWDQPSRNICGGKNIWHHYSLSSSSLSPSTQASSFSWRIASTSIQSLCTLLWVTGASFCCSFSIFGTVLTPKVKGCLKMWKMESANTKITEIQAQNKSMNETYILSSLTIEIFPCAVHFVYFSKPRACIFMISYWGFWYLRAQHFQIAESSDN